MSLSSANILAIADAITDGVLLSTNIDYAIPSPFEFRGKDDFFASLNDDKDTKLEIETALIRAAWLRYLNFEDESDIEGTERDVEGPVRTFIYELTVFHESTFERLDETLTPDAFNKQIRKTNHEHVTAIMSIVGNFQGVNSITALAPSVFAVAETMTPAQLDNSEFNVPCDYVPGVTGDQTKLEMRVRVQMPC